MNQYEKHPIRLYLTVFGIAVITALICFVPFLIMDKGYFIYYGDFNVQQIPFYQMCHDAIRSGEWGWSWTTDLGANFIGSYAFYLIGSPFFWLTIPFPSEVVPYLMAPLLILKIGVAAVTSFGLLKRFVRDWHYALIGALLYAFSGYSIYNIFFNHFHEVLAFFPLLLIGLEEFVMNRRRGAFALAVALNAIVNYYFFFGEVIFVVLYFFVRLCCCREFRLNVRQFLLLVLEAVLGLLLSAMLLVPALMAIMGNPRTDNFLLGWSGLFYGNVQRYGLILQSFFYPPDIPAYPNFFPDSNAKWSSVSMFLPLFSMTGVFAYLKASKQRWLKVLLGISAVMMFVPILNSAFSAFNSAYYARWFYMPMLMMALMTVLALERHREAFSFGLKTTGIVAAAFALISVFPSYEDGEIVFGKLPKYQDRLWAYVLVVLMGLVLTALVIRMKKKTFFRAATLCTCFMSVVTAILILMLGKGSPSISHQVIEQGLNGREKMTFLDADDDLFYRIDLANCMDNWPMFWKTPSIQAFQSVVPGSIFSFYDAIGVERSVGSRPELEHKGLRYLTSVKYLLAKESAKEQPELEGFSYLTTQNELKVYENQYFIPMGFCYDYYVDEERFEKVSKSQRDCLMVAAIQLSDEQIARYGDLLAPLPEGQEGGVSGKKLLEHAQARAQTACRTFQPDAYGFSAIIETSEPELVFFSVPYEAGFTATVNGAPADVELVNQGFMAVAVPAGVSEIRFDYETPGLKLGLLISLAAVVLLLFYLLCYRLWLRKHPQMACSRYAHRNELQLLPKIAAEEAYLGTIRTKANQILESGQALPMERDAAVSQQTVSDGTETEPIEKNPAPMEDLPETPHQPETPTEKGNE